MHGSRGGNRGGILCGLVLCCKWLVGGLCGYTSLDIKLIDGFRLRSWPILCCRGGWLEIMESSISGILFFFVLLWGMMECCRGGGLVIIDFLTKHGRLLGKDLFQKSSHKINTTNFLLNSARLYYTFCIFSKLGRLLLQREQTQPLPILLSKLDYLKRERTKRYIQIFISSLSPSFCTLSNHPRVYFSKKE